VHALRPVAVLNELSTLTTIAIGQVTRHASMRASMLVLFAVSPFGMIAEQFGAWPLVTRQRNSHRANEPDGEPRVTFTVRAAISGSVRDVAGKPIAGATLQIGKSNSSTRSDSAGRFRLFDVPMGRYEITARAAGYVPASTSVLVNGEADVVCDFALTVSVPRLDSLVTRADAIDFRMSEFEEHRVLGLGKFVTRLQLDAQRGQSMATILAKVNSVGIVRGMGNRGWILSRRMPGGNLYIPEKTERFQGMVKGCYAQVYLDSQLMNPGQPTEPFDVNTVSADQLEGVEWYAGPSQTPAKYARLNSACGVYVMHTRR